MSRFKNFMNRVIEKRHALVSALVLTVFGFNTVALPVYAAQTSATEDDTFGSIFKDHPMYEDNVCGGASTPTNTGGGSASGKVFMVGDSITNGSKTLLETALKGAGFSDVSIDARDGRPLSEGISVLNNTKAQHDGTVIIALGTNGGFTADSIKQALDAAKPASKIYWVNIGVDNSKRNPPPINGDSLNQLLNDNISAGYAVIDWASQVKAHPEYIDPNPSTGLGVHPIGDGKQAFANTVSAGASGGGTSAPQATSSGTSGSCCAAGGPATELTGSDNEQKSWNFLIGKGMSTVQAAGSMGNMKVESAGKFEPKQLEIQYSQPPHMWEKPLELPVPIGPAGQPGLGIVQWTSVGRKQKLLDKAKSMKAQSVIDLGVQLEFMWQELNESPYKERALDPILKSNDLAQVVHLWQDNYEVGANFQPRMDAAQAYMTTYGSGTPSTSGSASGDSGSSTSGSTCGGSAQGTGSGTLAWPEPPTGSIFQCFTWNGSTGHPGLDITGGPDGTPVFAAADGTVTKAGNVDGYGPNFVAIKHANNMGTSYGHMRSMSVKVGDQVKQNQQIGEQGNLGDSHGTHVHFNVFPGEYSGWDTPNIDPLKNGLTIPNGVGNPNNCT